MTNTTMMMVPMFMPFSSGSLYARLSSPETDDRRSSGALPIVCFDGIEALEESDGHVCNWLEFITSGKQCQAAAIGSRKARMTAPQRASSERDAFISGEAGLETASPLRAIR
jgi:hypothetical protein